MIAGEDFLFDKKGGRRLFYYYILIIKIRGRRDFSEKEGGEDFFFEKTRGRRLFLLLQFEHQNFSFQKKTYMRGAKGAKTNFSRNSA